MASDLGSEIAAAEAIVNVDDGNTSGITPRFSLPHSGITVSCPRWVYTTANVGHAYPGRGVPPDHSPVRTVKDVLAGRDVELKAIEKGLPPVSRKRTAGFPKK